MAEAEEKGHDSIITIGGIQSNHARATAVASRYLGLPCHLVLRNSKALADSGAGWAGTRAAGRAVCFNSGSVSNWLPKEHQLHRTADMLLHLDRLPRFCFAGARPPLLFTGRPWPGGQPACGAAHRRRSVAGGVRQALHSAQGSAEQARATACAVAAPQVTKEEYGQYGGPALGERLAGQLRRERGLNPFVIPVGGSSSMGVWG